jgi:hypothetical protein
VKTAAILSLNPLPKTFDGADIESNNATDAGSYGSVSASAAAVISVGAALCGIADLHKALPSNALG